MEAIQVKLEHLTFQLAIGMASFESNSKFCHNYTIFLGFRFGNQPKFNASVLTQPLIAQRKCRRRRDVENYTFEEMF